jgi:hypothetical protein
MPRALSREGSRKQAAGVQHTAIWRAPSPWALLLCRLRHGVQRLVWVGLEKTTVEKDVDEHQDTKTCIRQDKKRKNYKRTILYIYIYIFIYFLKLYLDLCSDGGSGGLDLVLDLQIPYLPTANSAACLTLAYSTFCSAGLVSTFCSGNVLRGMPMYCDAK